MCWWNPSLRDLIQFTFAGFKIFVIVDEKLSLFYLKIFYFIEIKALFITVYDCERAIGKNQCLLRGDWVFPKPSKDFYQTGKKRSYLCPPLSYTPK